VRSIVLEEVVKVFPGGVIAVRDLSFEVADGEFVVMVGPSGCGKSTTLRMVAGLDEVTSGRIWINGRDVTNLPPRYRDIAMVFQNYALYAHMTVRDNMGFGLKMAKVPTAELDARVSEAAKVLDIVELLQRKPKQLSGGQRQRVAMGRALVRQPAAFLMDEPLSNLDAKLRVEMRGEITSLQRRIGTPSLYVTHDQTEAMTMGDRVAVLRDGVLEQLGTPTELYEMPANDFVASFIGSPAMNFLPGRLRLDADRQVVDLGPWEIGLSRRVLERKPGLAGFNGRAITVGIRPEDFGDGNLGAGQDVVTLPVTVLRSESSGSDVMAYVERGHPDGREKFAKPDNKSIIPIIARLDRRAHWSKGLAAWLSVDPDRLYFFDPETGLSV